MLRYPPVTPLGRFGVESHLAHSLRAAFHSSSQSGSFLLPPLGYEPRSKQSYRGPSSPFRHSLSTDRIHRGAKRGPTTALRQPCSLPQQLQPQASGTLTHSRLASQRVAMLYWVHCPYWHLATVAVTTHVH